MNPPSTPDQIIAEVAVEPLDALLRQIVNGYFVLTDGNGAVSKWSEPAELLFGRTAEEILGESFFETLIGGALPPAGQAWRMFLDTGEPPRVPGTVRAAPNRAANARVSRVWAESPPDSDRGSPTTTRSAPSDATSSTSAANPRLEPGRSTGSSGVASVPVGSETATPQRAAP